MFAENNNKNSILKRIMPYSEFVSLTWHEILDVLNTDCPVTREVARLKTEYLAEFAAKNIFTAMPMIDAISTDIERVAMVECYKHYKNIDAK